MPSPTKEQVKNIAGVGTGEYSLSFFKGMRNGRIHEVETWFFTVKPLAIIRVEKKEMLTGKMTLSEDIKDGENDKRTEIIKAWIFKHDDTPLSEAVGGMGETLWMLNELQFSEADAAEIKKAWLFQDL